MFIDSVVTLVIVGAIFAPLAAVLALSIATAFNK